MRLCSLAIPEPPKSIHMYVGDDMLAMRWRHFETNGKPVLKFNVRVTDLSGRVMFEKASYKPHVRFHHVQSRQGLRAEVNVMTSAGLSVWSKPVVYQPSGRREESVTRRTCGGSDVCACVWRDGDGPRESHKSWNVDVLLLLLHDPTCVRESSSQPRRPCWSLAEDAGAIDELHSGVLSAHDQPNCAVVEAVVLHERAGGSSSHHH